MKRLTDSCRTTLAKIQERGLHPTGSCIQTRPHVKTSTLTRGRGRLRLPACTHVPDSGYHTSCDCLQVISAHLNLLCNAHLNMQIIVCEGVCICFFPTDPIHSGLPRWLRGKQSTCQCWRCAFDPLVGKIPWSRKWQPTPGFLPGTSRGQRSLAGYSPWAHKELDVTECACTLFKVPGSRGWHPEICGVKASARGHSKGRCLGSRLPVWRVSCEEL